MSAVPVVCILGATGTGKTEAAIRLAETFGGTVINYDSRQIYRDLPIVTAQPTPAERARCPHLLYGFLPATAERSAGSFAGLVDACVARVRKKGLVPILVGGTGLYLRAVLEGLAPVPDIPAEVRRAVGEDWSRLGSQAMHARLAAVDPESAARIAPADRQRVTRALEVHAATGRPLSAWHRMGAGERPDYAPVKIGLSVPEGDFVLRLARRIEAMLEAGAVAEVARAASRHPGGTRALSGIGCAEIMAFLTGEMDLEAAKALWLKNTRAYAKRQMTWFRKEPGVAWFAPDDHRGMAASVRARLCSGGGISG
jgi:tRNA dimethylallyltransferase